MSAHRTKFHALKIYGRDMLQEAMKLDPVIGRGNEIHEVTKILSRRTKNNPVLIGEPGVGKTAIVEGLAQRIVGGKIPSLANVKLFESDMGSMVAGTQHRGAFEDRLQEILIEVEHAKMKVILFIDEIHLVLGAGQGKGPMNAANLLKPVLARGGLTCIGATTLKEYTKYVEKDPAFERRFQKVHVNEPSAPDAINILRGLKEGYEKYRRVWILDQALVDAVQLSSRYISDPYLPDKAIDLIDDACATVGTHFHNAPEEIYKVEMKRGYLEIEFHALKKLEIEFHALKKEKDDKRKARFVEVSQELGNLKDELELLMMKYEKEKERIKQLRKYEQKREELQLAWEEALSGGHMSKAFDLKYGSLREVRQAIAKIEGERDNRIMVTDTVGPEHIAEAVSVWTGIPVTKLGQDEKERLLGLSERLRKRVVGQDRAVEAVAEAVLRSRLGFSTKKQPTASFLFLGPTGVGKTELARALAEQLFDDEESLVRMDMSEYKEEHSITRLIGPPSGYVGHENGGQLTEAVKRRPYSIVLFDEVEKAHIAVIDILLQILGKGRLKDSQGQIVDFRNTVVLITSNLGAEHLLSSLEGNCSIEVARDKVMQKVNKYFRPEIRNMIDEIIIFEHLSHEHIIMVAKIQMKDVTNRFAEMGITIHVTEAALDFIMSKSYDPRYGARPTRQWIEKVVVTKLATLHAREEIQSNSIVRLDAEDGENGTELKYNLE